MGNLCRTLELDELISDPRFESAELRAQHTDAIPEVLARHFRRQSAAHANSMVKEIDEVFDDPQVIANGMLTQFEQPGVGDVTGVARLFRMSATAGLPWLRSPAPHRGEHTDEVLGLLGYGPAEIDALKASGTTG